jgi:Ohr subfamily peroxiredoxin
MTKIEKVLYTAKAHTTGGREGGASRTDDGRLDIKLSPPGSSGTGTNPEQLFAAGWSACFLSSIKIEAGKAKVKLPADVAIDAEVDLGKAGDAYPLAARLISMSACRESIAKLLRTCSTRPTSSAVIRTPHAATLRSRSTWSKPSLGRLRPSDSELLCGREARTISGDLLGPCRLR